MRHSEAKEALGQSAGGECGRRKMAGGRATAAIPVRAHPARAHIPLPKWGRRPRRRAHRLPLGKTTNGMHQFGGLNSFVVFHSDNEWYRMATLVVPYSHIRAPVVPYLSYLPQLSPLRFHRRPLSLSSSPLSKKREFLLAADERGWLPHSMGRTNGGQGSAAVYGTMVWKEG